VGTKELLKKVRKIEIRSRGLSNQIFSGQYHSAFKGSGMTFSEVREYQYGDPIKSIDWNVTARFNEPYVKVFEEERELTVILLVDVSASDGTGSKGQLKKDLITEICAVLAFSAIQNNDKIGVIFFSEKVEKFIPPKKGKSHILRIIRTLLNFEPEHKGTNISEALSYLSSVIKKKSTAFIISDFLDYNYEKAIKIANQRHDLVALRINDELENEIPNIGLIQISDPETGKTVWFDSSNKKSQIQYKANAKRFSDQTNSTLKKAGIDSAVIYTNKPFVKPLVQLFKRREASR